MSMKIDLPIQDGPGQNLIKDPDNPSGSLYAGNTINRQTFDTQFVLDLEYSIGIDRSRIYVTSVAKGTNHFIWEYTSCIVQFIVLERIDSTSLTLNEAVYLLTKSIQTKTSPLYIGTNTTNYTDSSYGLNVKTWDISLKLSYAISIIGSNAVQENYYINLGGLGTCDSNNSYLYPTYCEFEKFFEEDVSTALNVSYYRIQIMFIKQSALDSVYIFFRIYPDVYNKPNVQEAVNSLIDQVNDPNSALYRGNVTLRVDRTWGVSGSSGTTRSQAPIYTYKYYEIDSLKLDSPIRMTLYTAYDRCKANRRCNWGIIDLNQSTNEVKYFHQLFDQGTQFQVGLFLDFEDWRLGSRGFNWYGDTAPTLSNGNYLPKARAKAGVILGAHFSPFDQPSLGPIVPAYLTQTNEGLVLDRQLLSSQINQQEALVADIEGKVLFIDRNIETASMNAKLRARIDVKRNELIKRAKLIEWLDNETDELISLNSSQCVYQNCSLLFNTSSLSLTGVISGRGELRYTSNRTEVAVFTFNSIYLGPEVSVTVVGQRALSLVSRTTANINTTINAKPGTLGGMPGGGSVGRYESDSLSDDPQVILICQLNNYCDNLLGLGQSTVYNGSYNSSIETTVDTGMYATVPINSIVTNNINGPGSGNLRTQTFVVTTNATYYPEIQVITTSAQSGQTLSGGFQLFYLNYTTSIIPFDATSRMLKQTIEDDLNLSPPKNLPVEVNRIVDKRAGVGSVNVFRSVHDNQLGYSWFITFTSAIGNVDQLVVKSYLVSNKANVSLYTKQDGNQIGGFFRLIINGVSSPLIRSDATSSIFQSALLSIPFIRTSTVSRIDPTGNCNDGLCTNGPLKCKGYIWSISVSTNLSYDNISPTSPTSLERLVEGRDMIVVADGSMLTGTGANIYVYRGSSRSPVNIESKLNISFGFSLAYGGCGGSYGGQGGAGYAGSINTYPYNNKQLSDLLGGSGGCMNSKNPFDVNAYGRIPISLGGAGGGAIEIVSSNDIIIGNFGRIIMTGGDGIQSPEGGAGGGSGGAILLAAGGIVHNEGVLSVSGGNGAYGGVIQTNLSGGGGSGGRIAIYGQSITNDGTIDISGGACGVMKKNVTISTVDVISTLYLSSLIPIKAEDLLRLSGLFINPNLSVIFTNPLNLSTFNLNDSYLSVVTVNVTLDYTASMSLISQGYYSYLNLSDYQTIYVNLNELSTNISSNMINSLIINYLYQFAMDYYINTTISEIDLIYYSIHNFSTNSILMQTDVTNSLCSNIGSNGSLFTQALMTTSMLVKSTTGAENTSKALFMSNKEFTQSISGSYQEIYFAGNGPIIAFEASQPTRITFYMRVSNVQDESTKSNYGALFTLLSRGVEGLNISSVIGVFIGYQIMHGSNFGSAVDDKVYLKRLVTIDNYPTVDRWYKIDIFIIWSFDSDSNMYSVSIDDTLAAVNQTFTGDDIDGIRLSTTRAVDVWFDEIYVGFDNTMSFTCPSTNRRGTETKQPIQRAWSFDEVHGGDSNGYTVYKKMMRHYNHLDTTGSVPFDGQGAVEDYQDIKLQYSDGDYPLSQGKLHAGALLYITNSLRSAKTPTGRSSTLVSPNGLWYQPPDGTVKGGAGDGRYFYYIEYSYNSTLTSSLSGGIAACSAQDLTSWRFEGIVFHYSNISDQVFGNDGPFYLERPKVKYNAATNTYVMWAAMDHSNRTLAMSAAMTSPYEDGPFYFRRSFYPDGNRTRDQVIFFNNDVQAVLGRTYYQTVEYVLPKAIMQPVWESVKDRDGVTNYRASYHRAWYDIGYDNYNDIYLQRWRKENIPWNVTCVNKITGERRYVPYGTYLSTGTVCQDPDEYKEIEGQGNPIISSRFVSPEDLNYSWWRPTSVPAVLAQPWANNYRDGYCGIRKLNDDYENDDPALATFVPSDRSTCTNIDDNPIFATLQDKLIGILTVINTRRAKYMAISALTFDYLDTTGCLSTIEGELTSGDMISMIIEMGQFGLGAGDEISSTFAPPVTTSAFSTALDYKIRFKQYVSNYNDRASYSLACVLDGVCSVNFKDQISA